VQNVQNVAKLCPERTSDNTLKGENISCKIQKKFADKKVFFVEVVQVFG